MEEKHVRYPPQAILLRAFKREGELELWAGNAPGREYVLIHVYKICATSGELGPKRRFGDEQVPEGFYELDWFNPQSNFFLSMHISYPNASDRVLGSRANLGGDIFLHGNCVTIGCIPITDDGIKEVYWLAVLARTSGQHHIPIHIFPTRLTAATPKTLEAYPSASRDTVALWRNLKQGFDYFNDHHREPKITVSREGIYGFVDAGSISGSN